MESFDELQERELEVIQGVCLALDVSHGFHWQGTSRFDQVDQRISVLSLVSHLRRRFRTDREQDSLEGE